MIFKKIISGLASDKNRVATRKGSGEVYHRQIKVYKFTILGIYTTRTLHLAPGNLYYIVVDSILKN